MLFLNLVKEVVWVVESYSCAAVRSAESTWRDPLWISYVAFCSVMSLVSYLSLTNSVDSQALPMLPTLGAHGLKTHLGH